MVKIGLFRKILSITLLILLFGTWLIIRSLTLDHVEDQLRIQHQSHLNKLASFTQEWLDSSQSLLEFTASMRPIRSMVPLQQKPILIQLKTYLPANYHTMVLDREGISRVDTDGKDVEGSDFSDRDYFQALKNEALNYTTEIIIGRTSKKTNSHPGG